MVQSAEEFKDDDMPTNTLELFIELDVTLKMISDLKDVFNKGFEKCYEQYSEILSRYQEQPHLLDPHLVNLIEKILVIIRDVESPDGLVHASFKYLYQICKVRTFKVFVKFLPHELSDLDFVLNLLEKQDLEDSEKWETRYMLLLWMSILILNPFHLSRLDVYSTSAAPNTAVPTSTKMGRIYNICKINCRGNDSCSTVASFLAAKFLIRNDIKDIYLAPFFDWVFDEVKNDGTAVRYGSLAAIASIFKHGKREDLLHFAPHVLKWLLEQDFKNSTDFLKNKLYVKIIQRLGLTLLPPKIAKWRYQRGSRSLQQNLSAQQENSVVELMGTNLKGQEIDDDDVDVPEEIEEIVEELLQGLKSASGEVRWLSAKGIGRVTCRLPKSLGDEVVGSVIEILNPLEQHEAWHGSCLAVAELAKRGLLLPYRLTNLVPLLLQALCYDEMKGYMSVGQNIRDSACYVCWAFARAYNPSDLQPFVQQISTGLLITTVFDREINCRRAASAAFQESVGRLGTFPHGIDILTTADFYSVGLRTNSFLHVSDFIAQYEEYTTALIDHLIDRKINHWDIVIRELTAKTLHKLTARAPAYMANEVLTALFAKVDSIDINLRHGAVLAIGEIVLALSEIEGNWISPVALIELNGLIIKFQNREQFRGMSGELMKQSCLDMISNCSKAKLNANAECIESWQMLIDKCIVHKTVRIRDLSVEALSNLCKIYYNQTECLDSNTKFLQDYLKNSNNDLEEHVRMGYVLAIGAMPQFILLQSIHEVVDQLIELALVPNEDEVRRKGQNPIILNWSEARRDSVKALAHVVQTISFENLDQETLKKVFDCFLKALDEYTVDNRGDIGAWVREASTNALHQMLIGCPHDRLQPDIVHQVMSGFAQQSVEKIDRTRGLAGKMFCSLVNHEPKIPYIQCHDKLLKLFSEDSSKILWLFADHTFPLFCSMLEYPEYSSRILTGLIGSIGQLTESLIKYSSTAFLDYLKSHEEDILRICEEIITIFRDNLLVERITYPMLNFLDMILSSGTLANILEDENSKFPEEIFALVNLEIKGHKKLYKLVSSVNVFCQLIQVRRLCPKILTKLGIFLGLTHVHVRKSAAIKFYEAMLIYGDTTDIPEDNMDEILNLLSETDWGQSLAEIRPIRNQICELMGVAPPVSANSVVNKN